MELILSISTIVKVKMKASILKKFFDNQRETQPPREEMVTNLKEEMCETVSEQDTQTDSFDEDIETIDFLLKRNWFLDREGIVDLLWTANEDVFQEIVKRVGTYAGNIQEVIYSFLPLEHPNIKLKVREITDEEAELYELQKKKERQIGHHQRAYFY
jgi:hypothetical protein